MTDRVLLLISGSGGPDCLREKDSFAKSTDGGRMNSILVEFEDGMKVITSRYAVRKINPEE